MRPDSLLAPLFALLLALGIPAAAKEPASRPEIQVMSPWHVFGGAPARLSGQRFTNEVVTITGLGNFTPFLLPALIDGLASRGFTAYPALFATGLPIVSVLASREEVAHFVSREPREQARYFTLVPIVYRLQIARRSLMREDEMEVRFRLELCARTADGRLGGTLLDRDFTFPFTAQGDNLWGDVAALLPAIRDRIAGLPDWDSVAARIPVLAKGFQDRFQLPKDTVRDRDGDREYLAQSEIIKNLPEGRERVLKAGFRCTGKGGGSLEDLSFPFQANSKWPEFLYAYIIKPDHKVIRIGEGEAHVEQSPGAIPGKIYDWSRVLVVNLPGLEPGSIVAYAVRLLDRLPDTAWSEGKGKRRRIPSAVANDVHILATHGRGFQIGVWTEAGDTVRFAARQALLDTVESIAVGDNILYTVSGRGIPTPKVRGYGPDFEGFNPIVRLSNRKNWSQLLRPVKDSVFSRVPPVAPTRKPPDRAAAESMILNVHRFIQDSLRYVALAFGERAFVPAPPETTLARRMGDCKDFSILMISRLRQQGVAAYPALVHSEIPRNLFPGPPSSDASNHMIVHVPAFGLWIDPTAPVTPPGILPWHLSGGEALALFPDSIALSDLPRNQEGAYAGKSDCRCKVKGRDLECERSIVFSQVDSWRWRAWLRDSPQEKWPYRLHPGNWEAACRISETGTRVLHYDDAGANLELIRTFTAHEAVVRIGGKTVVRFPETPFQSLFRLAAVRDTSEPLRLYQPVRETVTIVLETARSLRWPTFRPLDRKGMVIAISHPAANSVRAVISLPAGGIEGEDREELQRALERYKEFFTAMLIEG